MNESSRLSLLIFVIFAQNCYTRHLRTIEDEELIIRKQLMLLQEKLETFVKRKYPEANVEERNKILKLLVIKMKKEIFQDLVRRLDTGFSKSHLLARML